MRAPRFANLDRPTRWSRVLIVHALRNFERREGRRVRCNETHTPPPGVPSHTTIREHFGSFRAACVAAYGEALPQGGNREEHKDPDTEEVIHALAAGYTLTELGAERGISGQALGRRVMRYQAAHDLPVIGQKPGRKAKAA